MMSIFKDFHPFERNGEKWVRLEDLLKYFTKNHTPQDRTKKIRKDNILRELRNYKSTPSVDIGEDQHLIVSLTLLLRFIFTHADDYESCQKLVIQITSKVSNISSKPLEENRLVIDLYKNVLKSKLKGSAELLHNINFKDIQSLHGQYKEEFSDEEWKMICLFEYHFGKYIEKSNLEYDESLQLKWEYLDSLENVKSIGKEWIKISCIVSKIRKERLLSADILESIVVQCRLQHRPVYLDAFLHEKLLIYYPNVIKKIVCTSTPSSEKDNTLEVYVELSEDLTQDDLQMISSHISHLLANQHAVITSAVHFYQSGAFQNYTSHNNAVARFSLRDDIYLNKLDGIVINRFVPIIDKDTIDPDSIDNDGKCDKCFSEDMALPLWIQEFDILQEWILDVPLDVQILFENFINKDTLSRSENKVDIYRNKLKQLYAVYDGILNISNKHHVGILQRNNTKELLMQYHSIASVFSITSYYGLTLSLTHAENKLKEQAFDDNCYFNTYIKKHNIKYVTAAGLDDKQVSLRDCYLIVMMDNLVRPKFHSDPNPGESRSKQICTLPITLQGMPKDTLEVEKWHDVNICDGSSKCPCKLATSLSKEVVLKVLLELLPVEKDSMNRFSQLCTWSNAEIWKSHTLESVLQEVGLYASSAEDNINLTNHNDHDDPRTIQLPTNYEDITSISNRGDTTTEQKTEGWSYDDEFIGIELTEDYSRDKRDNFATAFDTLDNLDDVHEEENIYSILKGARVVLDELDQEDIFEEMFTPLEPTNHEQSAVDMNISGLESSMINLSLDEETEEPNTSQPTPHLFGFHKFVVPAMITRHPPPAIGRDDDMNKLREVLDVILVKSGNTSDSNDRILFGPDNKIGANLLNLIKYDDKYRKFIPEFPLLHLRKSKITVLFSSYKNAGLLHLFMYMIGDDQQDWGKLISAQHIDVATRYIRRMSLALHNAFLIKFISTLDHTSRAEILNDLQNTNIEKTAQKWHNRLQDFIDKGKSINATFALHADIMAHCDEVVAISLSERLGGEGGYNLLLAAVKSSLLFGFVNGASSYAPFCTKLLLEHYSAGTFHQNLKKTLYSTPIGESDINFSGDTKREMDHQDVLKSFRSGSTFNSVLGRMSLIDPLNEARSSSHHNASAKQADEDNLGWKTTRVDVQHIVPVIKLILRRDALSLEPCTIPYNMYSKQPTVLSTSILDVNSFPTGSYLMQKYLVKEGICEFNSTDLPKIDEVQGPRDLLNRAKRSTGITIRRSTQKAVKIPKSQRDEKEEKRKRIVKQQAKKTEGLSSEMNTCQALVKPDCSKPTPQKGQGIQKALLSLITTPAGVDNKLININLKTIPHYASQKIHGATVEFAGYKFKAFVSSGQQYLKYVQNSVIKKSLLMLPNVKRMVLCEEKYRYTPDDFKSQTRAQRNKSEKTNITHLKAENEMLSASVYNKEALCTTSAGKSLISTYLAQNVHHIQVESELVLDIDSEFYELGCECASNKLKCTCPKYTIPVRCVFSKLSATPTISKLENIHQCKGEGEMAQADWLLDMIADLQPGQAVCSIVSSGDIDAIVIHLFMISSKWPRNNERKFIYPVYVILKKHEKMDLYDITGMLEVLEERTGDSDIGLKIAVSLCIGGNDFVPKIYGQSHHAILNKVLESEHFREMMFSITVVDDALRMELNKDVFAEMIKCLYCPKNKDANSLTFEDIRSYTMRLTKQDTAITPTSALRNPQLWMPPRSAIDQLADIVNLQILYLLTAGDHAAPLPNFLAYSCLKKSTTGEIEYDFGHESRINVTNLLNISQKRKLEETPQKKERKRKPLFASTPKQK